VAADQKGHFLAANLRNTALQVIGDLSIDGTVSYDVLVEKLGRQFGPGGQAEVYLTELRARRRKNGESVRELGQAIRRLTALAYPEVPVELRDRLGKSHFLDAITSNDQRIRVFQAKTSNLDDAVKIVLELKTITELESQDGLCRNKKRCHTIDKSDAMHNEELQELLLKLQKSQNNDLQNMKRNILEIKRALCREERKYQKLERGTYKNKKCYLCEEEGHFKRNCPKRRNQQENDKELTPGTGGQFKR